MKLIYEFTPDERRVIAQAYTKYAQVLQTISDLHQLEGQIVVSPDLRGFLGNDPVQNPPTPGN